MTAEPTPPLSEHFNSADSDTNVKRAEDRYDSAQEAYNANPSVETAMVLDHARASLFRARRAAQEVTR